MSKRKTYWKRFEELHGYLLAAGAIVDRIHLKPRSYDKLQKEVIPIKGLPSHDFWGELTGAVTYYGPVKIVKDKTGVSL